MPRSCYYAFHVKVSGLKLRLMFNFNMKQRGTRASILGSEFWLFLFLIWTFGATCVTIEGKIPENTATNSLSANKYMNNTDTATPLINTTIYISSQIPDKSNASNSPTGERPPSFGLSESEGRELLGANADSANGKSSTINYNDIPHGYHGSNSRPDKAANSYHRPCNPDNRCRGDGKSVKHNGKKSSRVLPLIHLPI